MSRFCPPVVPELYKRERAKLVSANKIALTQPFKLSLTWVLKSSNLVQELLDSHRLFSQILHVDFPLSLIHQEHAWGKHAHPPNTVHAFYFLLHALFGKLLIQNCNSVLFREALFDDTSLAEKFAQEKSTLGSLAQQISLIAVVIVLHHIFLLIILAT